MQYTGLAFLHMELNVENPVFAGDTIHTECGIIEARRSKSRPDRGLVRTRVRVDKKDGGRELPADRQILKAEAEPDRLHSILRGRFPGQQSNTRMRY
jgi:acyl dehydratase